MIYGIISDIHSHAYSTFSRLTLDGYNSRLVATLNEIERAADTVIANDGHLLVLDGDLFHSRGSIDPEVFNLTHETFVRILDKYPGLQIEGIPGNHDLKSDDTKDISNAFRSFEAIDRQRVRIHHEAMLRIVGDVSLAFVPWRKRREDLLDDIAKLAAQATALASTDLHLHAGIDGVLSGMPDHGLTAKMLASFGFRRVFSGHYHHHKEVEPSVFSVGALTHQTWGDVGTKAGFLIVSDKEVRYQASHAPSFVDVTGLDESDMALACDGNFVRFRGQNMKESEVAELRKFFLENGAQGVSIEGTKEKASARGTAVQAKGVTIDQSVASFVDNAFPNATKERVAAIKSGAANVLAEVRSFAGAA